MSPEMERAGLKLVFYLISDPKVSQLIEAIEEFEKALAHDSAHDGAHGAHDETNRDVSVNDGVTSKGRMLRPYLSDKLLGKNR